MVSSRQNFFADRQIFFADSQKILFACRKKILFTCHHIRASNRTHEGNLQAKIC